MNKLPRKRLALISAAVLLCLGVGGAFAYWSVGGTGAASATTATTAPLIATQTSTIVNLRPGGAAQPLSGNFTNPNAGSVYVTNVVGTIAAVTKAPGAPSGSCDATDYTLTNATMAVGAEVASGTGVGSWTGATIAFNDKAGVNQDACRSARVDLAYFVN